MEIIREIRGQRVITTAYFSLVNEKEVRVKAGDDAADAAWFTVKLKKRGIEGCHDGCSGDKKRRFFTGTGK